MPNLETQKFRTFQIIRKLNYWQTCIEGTSWKLSSLSTKLYRWYMFHGCNQSDFFISTAFRPQGFLWQFTKSAPCWGEKWCIQWTKTYCQKFCDFIIFSIPCLLDQQNISGCIYDLLIIASSSSQGSIVAKWPYFVLAFLWSLSKIGFSTSSLAEGRQTGSGSCIAW